MPLLGRRAQEPPQQPTTILRVPGRKRRMLVGNEYHPAGYQGAREGAAVDVELVPEPTNPHDPNALAAYVNGQRAGYLGRGPAHQYQPLIRHANVLGYRVIVSGKFERPSGGPLSVTAQMPEPRDFANWLAQPAAVRAVGFTG